MVLVDVCVGGRLFEVLYDILKMVLKEISKWYVYINIFILLFCI